MRGRICLGCVGFGVFVCVSGCGMFGLDVLAGSKVGKRLIILLNLDSGTLVFNLEKRFNNISFDQTHDLCVHRVLRVMKYSPIGSLSGKNCQGDRVMF